MNGTFKTFFELLKSGLSGVKVNVNPEVDWKVIYSVALEHEVIAIVYAGILNSQIEISKELADKFEASVTKYIMNDFMLESGFKRICSAFDENGIDYLPVKGILMRDLYPKPEMRPMGDIDILIKTEQYKKIDGVMKNIGFSLDTESDHEYVYSDSGTKTELHKSLIPTYIKDYYEYFKNGWDKAKQQNNHFYRLSDDDEFIYIFCHLTKHYRDGGINILHFADVWIYLKEKNINLDYVCAELEKMNILKFYNNVLKTAKSWFEGGEQDEMTEFITKRVVESGCWGDNFRKTQAGLLRDTNTNKKNLKLFKIRQFIFPSLKGMQQKYPVLKKAPYLLPAFWFVRMFESVKGFNKKVKRFESNVKLATEDNVSAYRQELNYVGLDYSFNDEE